MQPNENPTQLHLSRVEEGMPVYDHEDNKIGTVKSIRMGDENPETPEVETNQPNRMPFNGLDALIVDIFTASKEDLDPELQTRLLRHGYIRIDSFLNAPRFVMAEQIQIVSDDRVVLNVSEDDLIQQR
jgi:hypothetical protein